MFIEYYIVKISVAVVIFVSLSFFMCRRLQLLCNVDRLENHGLREVQAMYVAFFTVRLRFSVSVLGLLDVLAKQNVYASHILREFDSNEYVLVAPELQDCEFAKVANGKQIEIAGAT